MKKYNVLIIGAGEMGAFYDSPKSNTVLTHAHAFKQHKNFNLLGFYDVEQEKAKKAAMRWKVKPFFNLEEVLQKEKIDVVGVTVPDQYHCQILRKLAGCKLKLILTEKPLAENMVQAKKILEFYKNNKINILVNYSRRFLPDFINIKKNIETASYGNFIGGTGCYGKGLRHNGSHLIDLLRWFIGEIKSAYIIYRVADFSQGDPSLTAILDFQNKQHFFLQAISHRFFSIFEVDFLFEKKRLVIKDAGAKIEEYSVRTHPVFKKNKVMVKKKTTILPISSMIYVVDNIYQFLTRGEPLRCNLEEGYKTLETCFKITANIRNG